MKNILILSLVFFSFFSCIKKKYTCEFSGTNNIEYLKQIIHAENDTMAYCQAYSMFEDYKLKHKVQELESRIYIAGDNYKFKLTNDKGEDISNINFPSKKHFIYDLNLTNEKLLNLEKKKLGFDGYNEQQMSFIKMFKEYALKYKSRINDLSIKDIDKEYESELDSIGLFMGWKGKISNIKQEEILGYTSLYYEITFKISKYSDMAFKGYNYFKTKDQLLNSHIYNRLKNLYDGEIIFVDGFINRNIDGSIRYGISDEETKATNPKYDFSAIEIYHEASKPLSKDLIEANKITNTYIVQYRKLINKDISPTEFRLTTSDIKKINLSNPYDIEYNRRYFTLLKKDYK